MTLSRRDILAARDTIEDQCFKATMRIARAEGNKLAARVWVLIANQQYKSLQNIKWPLPALLAPCFYREWDKGYQLGQRHMRTQLLDAVPDSLKSFAFETVAQKAASPGVRQIIELGRDTIDESPLSDFINARSINLAGDFSEAQMKRLRTDLIERVTGQEPISRKELTQRIQQNLEVGAARARAIARTELTFAYNAGRNQAAERSGLTTHMQFVAVTDDRVTDICLSRDGMVVPKGSPEHRASTPALHVNSVAKGTLINALRGLVPVEEIEPGERVLTHTGRYRLVDGKMCKPANGKMLRVTCENGASLDISIEHPILTSVGWVRADMLQAGDTVFQSVSEQPGPGMQPMPTVPESVLIQAANLPPLGCEETIAFDVVGFSHFMASAVQLQDKHVSRESDVNYVWADGELEYIFNLPSIEQQAHHALMQGRFFGIGCSNGICSLGSDCHISSGVVSSHPCRAGGMAGAVGFTKSVAPVLFFAGCDSDSAVKFKLDLLTFSPDRNIQPLSPVGQAPISKLVFSLNTSEASAAIDVLLNQEAPCSVSVHDWVPILVRSIVELQSTTAEVYDLSVEIDASYVAGGIAVHNCRSYWVGIMPDISRAHRNILNDPTNDPANRQMLPTVQGFGQTIVPTEAAPVAPGTSTDPQAAQARSARQRRRDNIIDAPDTELMAQEGFEHAAIETITEEGIDVQWIADTRVTSLDPDGPIGGHKLDSFVGQFDGETSFEKFVARQYQAQDQEAYIYGFSVNGSEAAGTVGRIDVRNVVAALENDYRRLMAEIPDGSLVMNVPYAEDGRQAMRQRQYQLRGFSRSSKFGDVQFAVKQGDRLVPLDMDQLEADFAFTPSRSARLRRRDNIIDLPDQALLNDPLFKSDDVLIADFGVTENGNPQLISAKTTITRIARDGSPLKSGNTISSTISSSEATSGFEGFIRRRFAEDGHDMYDYLFEVNNSFNAGSVGRRDVRNVVAALENDYRKLMQEIPDGTVVANRPWSGDGRQAMRVQQYRQRGFSELTNDGSQYAVKRGNRLEPLDVEQLYKEWRELNPAPEAATGPINISDLESFLSRMDDFAERSDIDISLDDS